MQKILFPFSKTEKMTEKLKTTKSDTNRILGVTANRLCRIQTCIIRDMKWDSLLFYPNFPLLHSSSSSSLLISASCISCPRKTSALLAQICWDVLQSSLLVSRSSCSRTPQTHLGDSAHYRGLWFLKHQLDLPFRSAPGYNTEKLTNKWENKYTKNAKDKMFASYPYEKIFLLFFITKLQGLHNQPRTFEILNICSNLMKHKNKLIKLPFTNIKVFFVIIVTETEGRQRRNYLPNLFRLTEAI